MKILLVISFFIPLVYIGHLMSKLDKFFAEGGFMLEDDERYPVAIVLGGTDLAKQVIELLQENKIPVLALSEPFLLQQEQSFRYLFALSKNDVDNIVLCKIGKKVYNIEKVISLCNDQGNKDMFISEKIRCLSSENITAQLLYDIIVKETEVKV